MLPFRSGRFRQLGVAVFFIFFALLICTAFAAQPKSSSKPSRSARPSPTAGEASSPGAPTSKTPAPLTNIPLPIGQEAKGLVLPEFDLQGRMRSKLEAAVAKRIDTDHMSFQGMKMTTFTPQNTVDLMIEMQTSVFDLNTRVMISHDRTTVARADFHISGDQAEFDTVANKGTLSGNVKMVITDASKFQKQPTK